MRWPKPGIRGRQAAGMGAASAAHTWIWSGLGGACAVTARWRHRSRWARAFGGGAFAPTCDPAEIFAYALLSNFSGSNLPPCHFIRSSWSGWLGSLIASRRS